MKHVESTNNLEVHQRRRAKYLADRPIRGEVESRDDEPIRVIEVNDFSFAVKVQSADSGTEWVPFDELTSKAD